MDGAKRDYYAGFEGEPEVRFHWTGDDGLERAVRLWVGYFDQIMSAIEPEEVGWTGLALPYHLNEGWYDSSPWPIPELESVIEQWRRIDTSRLDEPARAAHAEVLALLIEADTAHQPAWISYE
ncbi:uncharacterized protein SOCEGT47_072890 [Sorangium cellulosum]|jgi:hypothetical protein|uniref:Uncharacterized protein n=1 Tax=Sorangium cellulosum TaxID=56 RepID=A0A4P2QAV4_SORCE|nr:dihydroorotate dehydrogenase (quinone) [Sorangium cellulosum]AUX26719.1 uncharacterized protein SOCEGT47_072890 [Sorangium cellulosum]